MPDDFHLSFQMEFLKQRSMVLSNAAEVQLRLENHRRAIFFSTCAMFQNEPAVSVKAAGRRLRAVHALLSRRSPTGERECAWYPASLAVDKAGHFAIPLSLATDIAEAVGDETKTRSLHSTMNRLVSGGGFGGWLGRKTGNMQPLSTDASSADALWVMVMCYDMNSAARGMAKSFADPSLELSLAVGYSHGFTSRFFCRRQHVVESICARRIGRRMARRVVKDPEDRISRDGAEFDARHPEKLAAFVASTARQYIFYHGDKYDWSSEDSCRSTDDDDVLQGLEAGCPHRAVGCRCLSTSFHESMLMGYERAQPHDKM